MSEENLITIKVNQKEVEVNKNLTVMQACEIAGEEIPRFCYHDKLSIAGNCRMCLVEVEKAPKLMSSCTMPLMEGMSIITNSEKVKLGRKGVMEFLLINHPLDCPICDQGGECDLQDQAMYYGFDKSRFSENKRAVENKNMGPLVNTIMTRCIHCTRCVRFASEVAGVPEIGMLGRGENAEITTYLEKSITSELSGNVIDLCPVGALTSKPYKFKARPWELKRTDSIDIFDGVGSNIRIDSRAEEILRITPRVNEDINEEWITDKVRFNYDAYYNQRIDKPYIKKDSKLLVSNWDESLDILKNKLKKSSPFALVGPQTDLETGYAVSKFMSNFGTDRVEVRTDNQTILNDNPFSYIFNTGILNIEESDLIILIGVNPKLEAPIINYKILKSYNRGNDVYNIGDDINLNYPTNYLGKDINSLQDQNLIEKIKKSKNPIIIVGSAYSSHATPEDLKSLFVFSKNHNLITESKNNLNFLTPYASRVGQLLMGNTQSQEFEPMNFLESKFKDGSYDVLLSFNSEEISNPIFKDTFKVYFGHHGDLGAMSADLVLPTPLYTEKNSTFINTEGRPQEAFKCHNTIGQAKEEWAILKKLSELMDFKNDFNSFKDVRSGLLKDFKFNFELNSIIDFDLGIIFEDTIKFKSSTFNYPINNFYFSDVVSKNSKIMANCVEENTVSEQEKVVNQ
ncbi:MAG: NADH-quinone oxidoreductase subunit NuoG [Alphaproteobacteria bacterium]|jgi:NADH-quinone oxidoreductase subunit G|tara:strand:+ start:5487 stop:7535 length:2049 start_codon:yes stop_codon:yes gene_type:complete